MGEVRFSHNLRVMPGRQPLRSYGAYKELSDAFSLVLCCFCTIQMICICLNERTKKDLNYLLILTGVSYYCLAFVYVFFSLYLVLGLYLNFLLSIFLVAFVEQQKFNLYGLLS